MKTNKIKIVLFSLCMLVSIIGYSQITNKTIGAQEFSGEILIEADKNATWQVLTNVMEFCDIMGYKYLDGDRSFDRVGAMSRVEDWGETGNLILTKMITAKELRIGWEPENGSYFCSERWILTTEGNNTRVSFVLRYSESGKQSAESIREQIAHYNLVLAKLKRKLEY